MDYLDIIRTKLIEHLEQKGWKYTYDESKELFKLGFNIDSKIKETQVLIIPRKTSYKVYATINLNADSGSRAAVCEYLTRVNYGLNWGNFEMDMNDGEIRYKVFVDCGDNGECLPSFTVFENSVVLAVKSIMRYADDLLAVMYGFKTPEQACKDADAK